MDKLTDYIRWMGDFHISETGMRDADALVLCMLSYYDLTKMFAGGEGRVYLKDCRRLYTDGELRVCIAGRDMGYGEIFDAACASKRFGDLLVSDYVDLLSDDPPVQFSAECFHDGEGLSFIVYRGTDNSLAGCREDLMISCSHTRAQVMAAEYAQRLVKPGSAWFICGHSKGGNLALFAASSLDAERLGLVGRIYDLDGPGLCPEVSVSLSLGSIRNKTTCIQPEFSVIGKLFDPKMPDTRIVKSSAFGYMQHSLASWGIDHGDLALGVKNDAVSLWINGVLDRWIGNVSVEERLVFVSELFDALEAGGAVNIEDLADQGREGYGLILSRLKNSSRITKRIMADLLKQAVLKGFGPSQIKKIIGR